MQPVTKTLDELKSNWGHVPLLRDVFNKDKLLITLDRSNRYQITDEEILKIKAFPFEFVQSRTRLSLEVIAEIDNNIRDRFETEFHLKNYLQAIVDNMYYIMDAIRGLNYIDELEKTNLFLLPDLSGFNKIQIENSQLVVDFFHSHLTNYQNYQIVLKHAIEKQQRFAFLDKGNIEVQLEQKINESTKYSSLEIDKAIRNPNNIIPATSLKDLFKDVLKYETVMELMMKEGKILKTADGLQWHGYKRNAKYEAVAFLEILNAKGLLNEKINGYKPTIQILSATFSDYTCDQRTARNKNINLIARPKYDALLAIIN